MTEPTPRLLVAEGVTKVYRTGTTSVHALSGLDLAVGHGELVAVMGPSGSGKTFVGESAFVAVEGTLIGTVLGVVTTWVLYSNSPDFGSLDAAFPIAWGAIGITVGLTLVASLLATIGPARSAAAIRPAVAVRVAD